MKHLILFLTCLLLSTSAFSQVGIGTTAPHASAILDLTSTTQGLLPPRMTADQRDDDIDSPAQGLMIYCTNCGDGEMQVYNGDDWVTSLSTPISSAGLLSVTEGKAPNENTGYRRADAVAANYGTIGSGAVDLSASVYDSEDPNSGTYGATGTNSTAMGYKTLASGPYSTAMGAGTVASGDYSTAMGVELAAIGQASTAMGTGTLARGLASTAMGTGTLARGLASTAMGAYTIASDFGSVVMGQYNDAGSLASGDTSSNFFDPSVPAFVIGNGTSLNDKSDAFVVDFSGNVTIGGVVYLAGTDSDDTGKILVLDGETGAIVPTSLPIASETLTGFVSTEEQTFDGTKTFLADVLINELTVGKGGGNVLSNTAIGVAALSVNTNGQYNTAIGAQALYSNTTGNSNTANGVQALHLNTTGSNNTANGLQALYSNTIGSNNTATGLKALFSNVDGGSNTANGMDALKANTTGSFNTATGRSALIANTSGSDNTANGVSALFKNTTGDNNTAIGDFALHSNTSGSGNTAIGRQALFNNTTESNNTALGFYADVASVNLSNATAIGANAIVAASNTIQLGNTEIENVKTAGTLTAGAVTYPNINGTLDGQVLTTNADGVASWSTPISSAGLMSITEGSNTGYRRADAVADNYGTIGLGAVDLSFSGSASTTYGATGANAFATGARTTANGSKSTAMGGLTTASGTESTAIGSSTTASGSYSTAMGNNTTASDYGSVVMGQYNSTGSAATNAISFSTSAPAFVIGNGTASEKSDAFVVDFSGNVTAADTITATAFIGDGSELTNLPSSAGLMSITEGSNTGYRRADAVADNYGDIGSGAVDLSASVDSEEDSNSGTYGATGENSTAMGNVTTASGPYSTAMGTSTTASNFYSTAMGNGTTASGYNSTAIGRTTTASGRTSTAMGSGTTAKGDISTAMGNGTTASDYGSVVLGQYNNRGSSEISADTFNADAPAFVIGNGTSLNDKSDAFVVDFSGNITIGAGVYLAGIDSDDTGKILVLDGETGAIVPTLFPIASETDMGLVSTEAQTIAGTKTFSADALINGLTVGTGGGNVKGNTAIGREALNSNTTGTLNTAIGREALNSNTTGTLNTANGRSALYANKGGSYNTANGGSALPFNTDGSNNTANGYTALWSNTTGSGNTALGFNADVSSGALSNATAIGANAVVTASNTIQLGADVTNVKTSGTLTAGAVTYPNSHNDIAGQVLTTDANGVAAWSAPSTNPTFTGDVKATRYVLTAASGISASVTTKLDLSTGNVLTVNLNANITPIELENPAVGTYLIKFIQDGTGGRTVSFPTTNWKWSGGIVPVVTETANSTDIVTLIYDGTTYYAAISQNF